MASVGILENSNDIAAIFILAIPFSVSLLRGIKSAFVNNILTGIVFLFFTFLIWQSKSRGAVLGVGSFIVSWYWIKAKSKKQAAIITLTCLLFSVIVMSNIQRNADDREGSTTNRKIYWSAAVNMALRNPILGVGFNAYSDELITYTDGHVGTEGIHKTAHSTWLLALAETGIVGFGFYIGIWMCAMRSAWAMREDYPEFFMAIFSYGVTISFLSHTYMLYPYILLGLTIGLGQFYLKDKDYVPEWGLKAALSRQEIL